MSGPAWHIIPQPQTHVWHMCHQGCPQLESHQQKQCLCQCCSFLQTLHACYGKQSSAYMNCQGECGKSAHVWLSYSLFVCDYHCSGVGCLTGFRAHFGAQLLDRERLGGPSTCRNTCQISIMTRLDHFVTTFEKAEAFSPP